MQYGVKSGHPDRQRTHCLVLGVFDDSVLPAATLLLDDASGGAILDLLRRGDLDARMGAILMLYDVPNVNSERILLVNLGKEEEFSDKTYLKVCAAAAEELQRGGTTRAASFLTDLPLKNRDSAWRVRQAIIATEDALYRFDETKSEKQGPTHPLEQITWVFSDRRDAAQGETGIHEGQAIAAGVSLAKDLGNLPANICNPSYLAETAARLAKGQRRIQLSVIDEPEMEKMGMGALLAVSRGSEQPAKLIVLEYNGGQQKDGPIVLVGKGITFDTGGISIKPSEAMDEMKFDMCGAASVLGTLAAVARMELPINLVGVIASAENMPGGRASRPGDVVTTLSGKTVEILNTDAEGRLVLCDALTYAQQRFRPVQIIDIATLTGACITALGHHPSGLLANDDELAQALTRAGEQSGDRVWRLPLWDDYQEQLDSNFADMANIGGRPAGTITAACFLSRFIEDLPWCHLDIAGTAWKSGKEKGATGRPVSVLVHHLLEIVP